MALAQHFLEIYIVMLCLNAGILIVDGLVDTALVTPFDTTVTVTGVSDGPVTDIANFTDGSGTLVTNMTNTTLANSTIGGTGTLIQADTFHPLALVWGFIQFLTGGFLFDVLGLFGFPAIFTFSLQAIFGILLAITIVYYWLGR